ncbi:hypothetical protein ANCDUO_06339 [Ancylostoma duodenale]|uniref:Uncharacterized protein n=1 Tax=Ancylostoma duodenale TaxID=51022 RepID=A0A0C2GPW4_9BILA|nr:hypothetical protein ANCDUO_06339 [Ancylostoma duodenale]
MYKELVHKQPYSNIEKLSILVSFCEGDAARAIKKVLRTDDSYEKTIEQLKTQYQDPKRGTMIMIKQLKSMKQCKEDPRYLRNNLNDIQAIIATLRRQGKVVDTTHMISMVLETFSKKIRDEVIKKELDSGKDWKMEELLENLSLDFCTFTIYRMWAKPTISKLYKIPNCRSKNREAENAASVLEMV